MLKATVLYGHPTDPEAFEKYYAATHTPLALKINGMVKMEERLLITGWQNCILPAQPKCSNP